MHMSIGNGLFKPFVHMGLQGVMHVGMELLHKVPIRQIFTMQDMMQCVDSPVQAIVRELAIGMLTRLSRKQWKSLEEGMASMDKEIINSLMPIVMLVDNLRKGRVSNQTCRLIVKK